VTGTILVRAPVGVVYRTLTDLDGWPRWLTGCRSRRLDVLHGEEPSDRLALVLPRPRRLPGSGSWVVDITAHGWRHDLGVHWQVRGAVEVSVEWWLESRVDGTLLHHVVHESRSRRARVVRHHRVMMHAMQAMKDHLELAVAVASGRIP